MTWRGDLAPWLLGFAIAAGEWGSALVVAWLAWRLIHSGLEPGGVAGLCALLVLTCGVIGGVAFRRAVRGR